VESAFNIQIVPGGKVNILGGHRIGHSKQKLYTQMCAIPNILRNRAISPYSSKIVDKKEILRPVSNTDIYCLSNKVGTVYLVFLKIPTSKSMHFATRVRTWRVARLYSVHFFA
jgi:hypothetical protein